MVCLLPNVSVYMLSEPQQWPRSKKIQQFNSPFELQQLHSLIIKTATPLSAFPLSRVASVCALTPNFSYARQIFHQLDQHEIFIWNSCLKLFIASDSPIDAISLFYQLRKHNISPDSFTFSFVLKACVQLRDNTNCRIIHALIEKLGFQSNQFLQNELLHLYASCGNIDNAFLLFEKMPNRDVVTWNTMITQLVKISDIDSAYKVFAEMPDRNLRSWTAMISGFVQCGKPKEAVDVFIKMEEVGLKPNEVTLVSVLSACADLVALDLGIRVHDYVNRMGFKRDIRICNTLIDMYIKCGCLEAAYDVFEDMHQPTVVSWSSMIGGLAIHGKGCEALKLFSLMIQRGIQPNEVTFVGLLNACSHMGLIDEGRRFFGSMSRDYRITPCIEHYGCMVDILSRGGLLEEAYEFIKQMPVKANAAVWGAFLGGCKVYKNVEMAEIAMTKLEDLDPINDGYFVVMSNVYAEAKQWDDAARVRKLLKSKGLRKTIGWSRVTVGGIVHEFVAGDDSHPRSEEICKMWDQMQVHMRRLKGYVPNTSVVLLDMQEKEKEKCLSRHSEKLAVVFGIMNTKPGETIRIFKNLRICEDCHESFKIISEIMNRYIVVRDRNRFHCFKNGSCSCGDYW